MVTYFCRGELNTHVYFCVYCTSMHLFACVCVYVQASTGDVIITTVGTHSSTCSRRYNRTGVLVASNKPSSNHRPHVCGLEGPSNHQTIWSPKLTPSALNLKHLVMQTL